ncbi:hypothetical protein ACWC4J_03725 [Streptomyces sp. NPDC001356]
MNCTICEQPIEDGQPRKQVPRRDATGRRLPPAFTHKGCRRPPSAVPYIASWSTELAAELPRVVRRILGGVGYADEVAADRDERGVLLLRRPDRQGVGAPRRGKVHPARQMWAMTEQLCQVCGEPADQDDDGVLWLLEDARGDWAGWPNGLMTTHPPTCAACMRTAREECPHLWEGSVVVRVGRSELCGVWGRRYTASRLGPIPVERGVVPFGSPLLAWTVAAQYVRALYDCTIVSLDEVVAAHT